MASIALAYGIEVASQGRLRQASEKAEEANS
jgi:hypothetical protein